MSFTENLLKARHHIVFMCGLACASAIVVHIENLQKEEEAFRSGILELNEDRVGTLELSAREPASEKDLENARVAWRYFENNTDPNTGLANSVDGYPASTMWDTSSYLMGLISAHRLGVVSQTEFDKRMSLALESLHALELFNGALPNKSYNTNTLAMVDYENRATEKGIGWSAIDVGRVLVPLNILIWNYPEHTPAVRRVLSAWDFSAMLKDGALMGAAVTPDGDIQYVQEGRIGYEEYAAKTLSLMGLDVSRALRYVDFLDYEDIYDVAVPIDIRDPEKYNAHNYVVSESYVLDGLEFGWDRISGEFAQRVFLVQEARYQDTGLLTAVSEDNIDQAPYFVYNTVYSSGSSWNAITEDGEDASEFRSLSTKAAFGWDALFDNDYTNLLVDTAQDLKDDDKGFYSGYYEVLDRPNKALTANTNGIILESIAYKVLGPLVSIHAPMLSANTL